NDSIITSMARDLDINFSIICGKLEKYREDILGSLIINVDNDNRENIKDYLNWKKVRWEEIINE
ncbi:methionine ABC transporter ATP-binding protein, partial [Clostridium perfringens]